MRRNAIIRIIIWSVVALILIGIMLAVMMGWATVRWPSGNWAIGIVGGSYDNGHRYTAGATELSDPIHELDIEWISGSVTVLPYDGDTIRIHEEDAPTDTDMQMHWFVHNGKLSIKFRASTWFIGVSQLNSKHLTVELPADTVTQLRKIQIETTDASVNIQGITLEDIDVETVSGKIDLRDASADEVELSSTSGNITSSALTAEQLSLTTSGKLRLQGSFDRINTETVSGNIEIESDRTPRRLELDAVSGDLTLRCPEGDGFRLELDTVSGDFVCDYPTIKKNGGYICGNGSSEYEADTVSGDLYIKSITQG